MTYESKKGTAAAAISSLPICSAASTAGNSWSSRVPGGAEERAVEAASDAATPPEEPHHADSGLAQGLHDCLPLQLILDWTSATQVAQCVQATQQNPSAYSSALPREAPRKGGLTPPRESGPGLGHGEKAFHSSWCLVAENCKTKPDQARRTRPDQAI